MKLFLLAILGLALSSPSLNHPLSIGSTCTTGTPGYIIESFTITPWPISNQESVSIVMSGSLLNPTYVNQIWISSSSTNYFNNQEVIISQEYPVGNLTLPFTYQVEYPAGTWQVLVTLRDPSFNILSCWSFTYNSS